jgi:hypothetical protein
MHFASVQLTANTAALPSENEATCHSTRCATSRFWCSRFVMPYSSMARSIAVLGATALDARDAPGVPGNFFLRHDVRGS